MAFRAIRVTRAAIVAPQVKTSHPNTRLWGFKQSAVSSRHPEAPASTRQAICSLVPDRGHRRASPAQDVIQSDFSLVYLSAARFSLFYMLTDKAWESKGKEQSPEANTVSVSFVPQAARSPPAAAARLLC